jgi:hypothetical protein
MAHGGGSLAMDESLVPAEIAQRARTKEAEILEGLSRVNVNDSEPKSTR